MNEVAWQKGQHFKVALYCLIKEPYISHLPKALHEDHKQLEATTGSHIVQIWLYLPFISPSPTTPLINTHTHKITCCGWGGGGMVTTNCRKRELLFHKHKIVVTLCGDRLIIFFRISRLPAGFHYLVMRLKCKYFLFLMPKLHSLN